MYIRRWCVMVEAHWWHVRVRFRTAAVEKIQPSGADIPHTARHSQDTARTQEHCVDPAWCQSREACAV